MATKDKLVNLEDLKVVNDDLQSKVTSLNQALTEEIESATVTQTMSGESMAGTTVTALTSNTFQIYGTPTASRHLLLLNGQKSAAASSTAFAKTLPAGTYDVQYSSTGTDTPPVFYFTDNTFASRTKLNPSGSVTFENDVMIGMYVSTNFDFGTANNPTVVSFSAKKIVANDPIARQTIVEIASRYESLSHSDAITIPDNTDYNDLTTPGNYKCTSTSHAGKMTNAPFTTAHSLKVMKTSNATTIYQIAYGYSGRIVYRVYRAGTWDTEWKKVATVNEMQPIIDRVLADDIPSYYFANNYLPERIAKIQANRKTAGVKLIENVFFTDPHYWTVTTDTPLNGLQSTKLIKYIMDRTNIGTIVCGGDLVSGRMTPDQCITLFEAVRNLLTPIWDHTYMVVGNHEWNKPGSDYPAENLLKFPQFYNQFVADKYQSIGSCETNCGSYIVDDKLNSIRYFMLGCSSSGTLTYRQFQWFFNRVVDTPTGYTIIVYSHVGLAKRDGVVEYIDSTVVPFINLLDAAKTKAEFSYNWPNTSWTGTHNFANDNIDVACVLSGHCHGDIDKISDGGIPVISTTCDRGPSGGSGHEAFDAVRVIGTITEQAIDVVQIDITNKTIDLTRIGGSYDGTGAMADPDRHYTF